MKFDRSQFENLELENIAQWPPAAKLVASIFLAVVVIALGYWFLVNDKIKQLDAAIAEEATLRSQYQSKYHVAANLEAFRQQMIEAEELFAQQLKSLPESHETPGLLDDITFVGTTSGLNFSKLEWQPEVVQNTYIELPIDIVVVGEYHEFGHFVSKIAGLPRIVTLHDFKINKATSGDLELELQAKTYRYKEQSSTGQGANTP